ncbi:hypothetical protein ENBRE01_1437 [Enteropsectra breve]|nr:hypothetical protein ENBRE01_1437 [Enteropsectra breve]
MQGKRKNMWSIIVGFIIWLLYREPVQEQMNLDCPEQCPLGRFIVLDETNLETLSTDEWVVLISAENFTGAVCNKLKHKNVALINIDTYAGSKIAAALGFTHIKEHKDIKNGKIFKNGNFEKNLPEHVAWWYALDFFIYSMALNIKKRILNEITSTNVLHAATQILFLLFAKSDVTISFE